MVIERFSSLAFIAIAGLCGVPAEAQSLACDGQWNVVVERFKMVNHRGRLPNWEGTVVVKDGRYTLRALSEASLMLAQGPMEADCKIKQGTLTFQSNPTKFSFEMDLSNNPGIGKWNGSDDTGAADGAIRARH